MKEYCFYITDADGEDILQTWEPAEAYETAVKADNNGEEVTITADVFNHGYICGTENNVTVEMLADILGIEWY